MLILVKAAFKDIRKCWKLLVQLGENDALIYAFICHDRHLRHVFHITDQAVLNLVLST